MIELIAANDANGMSLWHTDVKSFACEIEADHWRIYMRHFAHIQAEPFKDNFRVNDEAARTQFEAWIMFLFQNQDSGGKTRVDLRQMQRCGESAWAAAEDENLDVHTPILP